MSVGGRADARVDALMATLPAMVDELAALVRIDSPTGDAPVLATAAGEVARRGTALLGRAPVTLERDGIRHLRWGPARPRLLLLGHYDTVWPTGTPARRPPELRGGCLFGPGGFDMKAGIVQGWTALRALGPPDDVAFLLTGDEERGAPTSAGLIAEHAAAAEAVLVLEPSVDGALKTARHGVTLQRLTVHGRAAHAGLDPRRGVNAVVELAHQVLALTAAAAGRDDFFLTPSKAVGGHASNVVPEQASCTIDVRSRTLVAQEQAAAIVADLRPHDPRARVETEIVAGCPPLEASASATLFALAGRVAEGLGLEPLRGAEVGGASDGNRTAALGVPTLDGLGAVGAGAHADDEHVVVAELPRRTALLIGLLEAMAA